MLSLGIETSCDETGAAVVEDGQRIIANVVSSSLALHQPFGGVVPELACRAHLEMINTLIKQTLSRAGLRFGRLGLVSVTYGPGLVGALLIGVSAAKALSYALRLPLAGVNHLQAHIYANFLSSEKGDPPAAPEFPFVSLVVSGGHTCLVYVKDVDNYRLLGRTEDDAVGEAFDKVAKILGLGYPGGPSIDSASRGSDPDKIKFTRPYLKKNNLNFSFSGIKTQVLYYVRKKCRINENGRYELDRAMVSDIAAGFQEAVVDVLTAKSIEACLRNGVQRLALGGGVSVNRRLRDKMKTACRQKGIELFYPEAVLCTDNAAMIAGLGWQFYNRGKVSGLDLSVRANPGIEG